MKILFLAYNPTSLAGILYVIEQLKMELSFEPVLACSGCYYETNDFEVINFEEKGFQAKRQGTQKQNVSTWYNKKNKSLYHQIKLFFQTYWNMTKLNSLAKRTSEVVKPDFWIITDDRVGGMHMALLKYAKKGKVIRIPAAMQADFNVSFYNREYDSSLVVENKPLDINQLQGRIGEKLIHSINGKSRTFYQTGEALAFYMLEMLPLHPWASGASKCDYVFTVSKLERQRVLEEAKPRIPMVAVTGLPEDYDIVNEVVASYSIREQYKDLGEEIVVLAIPQAAEHNEVSWDVHRANMRVLVNHINKQYGKVLLSLHPKSRKEDYVFLEQENLGYICEDKLAKIIHYVDVLICSENSSVREWAPLLGKKRLLLSESVLKTRIKDCNSVFAFDDKECSIGYREKDDVKKMSTEIIKAIDYLNEKAVHT